MAFGSLSPVAVQQFFDNNGEPLAGGQLAFYEAGTDTPTPAYADFPLTTPLPNPVILDAGGRAPALFLGALSYKQILRDANGVQLWSVDNIPTPTALRSAYSVLSLTGSQHDVPVPSGLISFIQFTNQSTVTVDGFAGGVPGQILIVRAAQGGQVDLVHAQGSAVGNQLFNFATSGPTSLAGLHGVAVYLYATPYWILLTHEQGQSIRVPYKAANFYPSMGSAGMTWVVEMVDVFAQDYILKGRSLTVTVALRDTTVSGTPSYLVVDGFPYRALIAARGVPALTEYGVGQFESTVVGQPIGERWCAFNRANLNGWADGAGIVHLSGQFLVDVE